MVERIPTGTAKIIGKITRIFMQPLYFPIITPLINLLEKLTNRPTYLDSFTQVVEDKLISPAVKQIEESGATEDRCGVLYIDPRIDREKYFKNREK